MNANEQFFFEHAGWSYNPKTETADEGRERGAIALAQAEQRFRESSCWFEWVHDDDADASFVNDWEPADREQWEASEHMAEGCVLYAPPENDHGKPRVLASLWGVFDADASYRRVVEAELASEVMS